jgi:hypothetical protein
MREENKQASNDIHALDEAIEQHAKNKPSNLRQMNCPERGFIIRKNSSASRERLPRVQIS